MKSTDKNLGTIRDKQPSSLRRVVRPLFVSEKRRISAYLRRHGMTLADVGVDSPATVAELNDPDIIRSLLDDIEEERESRRMYRAQRHLERAAGT